MNTPLFQQAARPFTIDELISRGYPIFYDEEKQFFFANGQALAKPSHIKTRKDAVQFASLNGFKLED